MKHSLLRVSARSPRAALDIHCVVPLKSAARRDARIRHRLLRLVLGASLTSGLSVTSLHAQNVPHGDHNPHHGGVVLMYGLDLHYEVVLSAAGDVQLWLSNAVREDLPASVVSDVAAEIESAGMRRNIDMTISDSGDAWVGKTNAVKAEGTTLHLGFVYHGEPATLSFPATSLLGKGREKLVKDTAHAPTTAAPPKGHEGHQGHEGHSMAPPDSGER